MEKRLVQIRKELQTALAKASSATEVETVEKQFLGRKGKTQELFDSLISLPAEEKKEWGQQLNQFKQDVSKQIEEKRKQFMAEGQEELDITLQKKLPLLSTVHPLSQVRQEVEDIFISMGFTIWDGPEVDTEYHNFEALNIPAYHPARDMQDTFYLTKEPYVLRTQTSNMQNRILRNSALPIRAIVPGRVYRYEATDASHDMTFHQCEGLMVDTDVSIAHMRFVMEEFLKTLFNKPVKTRFRPGYFPFVEPGMELDFFCTVCEGKGCRLCKYSGWVEFMGCGMVHSHVLREGGVDPDIYTGFAFGFGLTRLVMMRYKIDDIRLLHSADIRFLKQFI